MSFLGGSSSGADESRDLHNRLHPSFGNSSDVLNNSNFEAGMQTHPGLSSDVGSTDALPVPAASAAAAAVGGFPLVSPIGGTGTGSFLPPHPRAGDLIPAVPPERPVCTFFLRTGTCAYGDRCKFLHPRDRPPPVLNARGYPVRPDEADCAHYLKKGWCAFNLTCKFNHPDLPPAVLPSSAYGLATAAGQPFVTLPGGAGGSYATGAMYPLAPSALPFMYYLPSPIGAGNLGAVGGGGFQAGGYQGGLAGMQGGYAPGGGVAGPGFRQHQQQQQQGYGHVQDGGAVSQQQQQQQQQQQANQRDQLTTAMQKLRLGGRGDASRQYQQQQR